MTVKKITKRQLSEQIRGYVYEILEEELDKRLAKTTKKRPASQKKINENKRAKLRKMLAELK